MVHTLLNLSQRETNTRNKCQEQTARKGGTQSQGATAEVRHASPAAVYSDLTRN